MITNDVDEAILMADRIVTLTPGPRATLGRSFQVDLDRPRDKTTLNHDLRFKLLRNDITKYLLAIRQQHRDAESAASDTRTIHLPDLEPRIAKLPSMAIFNRSTLQS